MKETKKKNKSLNNKKKEEEEDENMVNAGCEPEEVEKEEANNDLGNDDNDLKTRQKPEQRRSGRNVAKKSLTEDEEEGTQSSDESPKKRASLRHSPRAGKGKKKTEDNSGEVNGDKVQSTRKDLRRSSRKVEEKTPVQPYQNEDGEKEEEGEETEGDTPKRSLKRKPISKRQESKKTKTGDDRNEESSGTLDSNENSSKSGKKGGGKKQKEKSDGEEDSDEEPTEEFEVEKLVDIYFKKNGEREFLVRWKGYSSKDDTWEPEKHLNCKELIDAFLEKCEKARSFPLREMRVERRKTERYTALEDVGGRKHSARLRHKPRITYYEVD